MTTQTECKRCGTCCLKGGPALHVNDKPLIDSQHISINDLICIRKGEPILAINGNVCPSEKELLKVNGRGATWTCRFYNPDQNQCDIYLSRPMECRLLKCWNTEDLENEIYKNNICRKDILPESNQILRFIDIQEEYCPYSKVSELAEEHKNSKDQNILDAIAELIEKDLSLRQEAVSLFNLSLDEELFYFGRPIFQNLNFYNMAIQEVEGRIKVTS